MTNLYQANREWASRPADERFTSLTALAAFKRGVRDGSSATTAVSRRLQLVPSDDHAGLTVQYDGGEMIEPTNWAFGQLTQRVGAPAKYLRELPSELVADCINYGLLTRDVEDLGLLSDAHTLKAVTGPNYGRVWDAELADALVARFGDGRTGQWRVPGEFGRQVTVTKENTTLYAGDRDMFVFLADEQNRVSVPHRRENRLVGSTGEMSRGFFCWNSEVGSKSLGAAFFLFDYVCCNRIVWGVEGFTEVRIRHTQGAPDRWLDEVQPVLVEYAESAAAPIQQTIEAARSKRLEDRVDAFLSTRFSRGVVAKINAAHLADEDRPIETLWDAVVGTTAYARQIPHQDARVAVERVAGDMLKLAA